VLDETKQQLGVMSLDAALGLARSKGLDLIEIAAQATPPVCRIVNYGKFLYEESKRSKESQGKQAANKMKELQISPAIDPHDFEVKLSHAVEFLCADMKVRIKLRFRGRQKAHKEIGFEVMNKFAKAAAAYGQADSPPKMLGDRDLNVILSPLPRNKRAKNPREAEAPAKETRTPTAAPAPTPPPASESAVLPAPGGQNAG
jgi:translation initiation factor IF-3